MIINRTRNAVLHDRPAWALTAWEKARGFMFRRPAGDAIIFLFMPAQVVRLHMWFVFGPIDVLGLDGTGRVVALKQDFRPWSFWSTGTPVSAVVELPAGTLARTGTQEGDHVALPKQKMTILK